MYQEHEEENSLLCTEGKVFLPEQADVKPTDLFSVVEFGSMGISHILLYQLLQKTGL